MGPIVGGFQFLLILDIWGISFHAVIVYGLGKNLLFKPVLGNCVTVHDLEFFRPHCVGLTLLSHRKTLMTVIDGNPKMENVIRFFPIITKIEPVIRYVLLVL